MPRVSVKAGELSSEKDTLIKPGKGWALFDLKELWYYRELYFFFIWRDITVKYKQTVLGVVWVVLQPVVTMVVFSVIFGRFAKMPSDDLPYPIKRLRRSNCQ